MSFLRAGLYSKMQGQKQQLLKEEFELIRVLGEGSFGKVYLIRNKRSKKEYALKRYSRSHLEKRGKYKNLIRSIFILQALKHPSIIGFVNYVISADEGTIYLLFEACKKGSLEKIKRLLTGDLRKWVLLQLAQALAYLKQMNVAHRDVKPPNITFDSKGQLKMIDFDEAVCFDPKFANLTQSRMLKDFGVNVAEVTALLHSQKSRASTFVGTQIYMSPEMLLSTVGDEKGDLWAYGCILYELYVGQYLHFEFDSQAKFQEQLNLRLAHMRQLQVQPAAIDLFLQIAKFNAKDRLEVEQVSEHQLFKGLRQIDKIEKCRDDLVRLLRGNHGLLQKTTLDACQMEVVGMRIGKELCEHLNTAVLLQRGDKKEFFDMIGGARYFKLRNCRNSEDKLYVFYCEIDSIALVDGRIIITSSRQQQKQVTRQTLQLQHIYPDMQHHLFQLMTIILQD